MLRLFLRAGLVTTRDLAIERVIVIRRFIEGTGCDGVRPSLAVRVTIGSFRPEPDSKWDELSPRVRPVEGGAP